jgi:hypothetical protein
MNTVHRQKSNRGFVGLLALLLVFVIIALVVVRTDLFSGVRGDKNALEQGLDAVEKTRELKSLLEKKTGGDE